MIAVSVKPRRSGPPFFWAALSSSSVFFASSVFFFSDFQVTKRAPMATKTTAVTPCEMGTMIGCLARKAVKPKKARPA